MKPTVTLAETTAPQGSALVLIEHDGEFYLQAGGVQLESSFVHNAAEQLAHLACGPFRSVRQPRVLLAGLGLGYTLAAAQKELQQRRGKFQVAEPLEDMPSWHRAHLGALHPGQLDDPRLEVSCQGLAAALKKPGEGFHAILLDAETSLPQEGVSDRKGLPHSSFLHRAHSALKEGGLLGVRYSADHSVLERRLRQAGFDLTHESVPASHKGKQKQHSTIWLARKGAYQSHARGSTDSNS